MADQRRGWKRWLVPAVAILVAGAFAYLNSGERVAVHLGLFVLFRIPLAALVFVTFLLGMTTMFLIGLRHDLRVRRVLRQYQIQEERQPWEPEPARRMSLGGDPSEPDPLAVEPHHPDPFQAEAVRTDTEEVPPASHRPAPLAPDFTQPQAAEPEAAEPPDGARREPPRPEPVQPESRRSDPPPNFPM